jgi:tetratricopeptide (TPR) repeat protein
MDEVAGQGNTVVVPVGQALALAERCRNEGRLEDATAVLRRVLEEHPDFPEAEHLLGVIAHQNGKLHEAIEHVQRAVKLSPQVAIYHANLGEMLRIAGQSKLAVEAARRALEIEPNMAAALSNLGVALYELKDFAGAEQAQRSAIAAKPDFAEAYCNLGNTLHAQHRFEESVAAYGCAVALKPNYADAWANLGTTLHHGGEVVEAVGALRRAVALSASHANAHSGLGLLLLMRGDFAEGWDEYEWRMRSSERKGPRFPEIPWQGESLVGKHIYVQAEQGFGDSLQFARYLPMLAARAGKVTFRVPQQLMTVMRESLPGIAVIGERGTPTPYQCDIPLMSLPRFFKTRLETIPAEVGYLRAPEDVVQRWNRRLETMPGLKVGVAWAGNPEHTNNHRRSIDLAQFEALFEVRGASFASLQFGPRAADLDLLKRPNPAVLDLASEIEGFTEPAGAISALDLVITVDTSVAHMAGALGKPVWVLLPWLTDWRWLLDREDSPWYPTMRLFRQKKGESWLDVMARVTNKLKAVVRGNETALMPFKAEGERRAAQAAAIMALEAANASRAEPARPSIPPGHALILAEQKRRQGFLADAEELAQRALAAEPDNIDAMHLLGIIAHQSGKTADAVDHLHRAIAAKPDVALYHANVGEMCRLLGRVDDAIAHGRRAIELNPDYAGALSNLGIALFDQGKFEEALTFYDRALALEDAFAQAHSNRGNALQRLKRFAEAEPAYRRALELQPNFGDAWNNLGTCLRELKRSADAETVYRKALEFKPNDPDTLDNLALALKDLNRLEEAAELMGRALAVEARSDKLHIHHATILLDQDRIEAAAAAVERGLALNPSNHDGLNVLGRIAFERGELDTALAHFRQALSLKPDLADALNNMGNVLKELGRLDEARQAYLDANRLDPDVTGVYVNLADSKTFTPGDAHLAAMEALAAKADGLSETDRMQLDFALGKAYADLKEHDRAFRHLIDANARKRATVAYDEDLVLGLFDRIEAIFSAELIAAKSGAGDPSPLPIFVLGMPRSGTTLVEQIIASHPAAHGAGELHSFNDVVLEVRTTDGKPLPYPEFAPALQHEAINTIGARYLMLLRQLATAALTGRPRDGQAFERVTDKMPSNYYFAGLIHLALPNATIIHTVRDPVDTCISCFSKLFSAEQNHTYDLGELGRYYQRYERLMAHWHRVLPAGRILDVRYEDVVDDLEGQARRILSHCGLPWDDRCLSFHETDRPVRTASASQVRLPIYKSAVGRGRHYEAHIGPLLQALGLPRRPAVKRTASG